MIKNTSDQTKTKNKKKLKDVKIHTSNFIKSKKRIIINPNHLKDSSFPVIFLHRDSELHLIMDLLKEVAFQEKNSQCIILQGKPGTGKTVIVSILGLCWQDNSFKNSEENIRKTNYVYFDCQSKLSAHFLLSQIIREILSDFPPYLDFKNYTETELEDIIYDLLIEKDLGLLICLDNIEYSIYGNNVLQRRIIESISRLCLLCQNVKQKKNVHVSIIMNTRCYSDIDILCSLIQTN